MSHKITPKQLKAIRLLAEGHSSVEVARKLRLRRETLSRWKRRPEFDQAFQDVLENLRADMRYRLVMLFDRSFHVITDELAGYQTDQKRVQTALSVLKFLGFEQIMPPNVPKKAPDSPKQQEPMRR